MYVTKRRLDEIIAAAELTEADAPLMAKVRPFIAYVNAQNGIIDESNQADIDAAATAIGETRSNTYKVARLAEAAGLLNKVS